MQGQPVLFGIDAGPEQVRCAAVGRAGEVLAVTSRTPTPADDPDAIWRAVEAGLGELQLGRGHTPVAIGVAAGADTVVAWDRRSGDPLHAALLGPDRRAAARCERLEAGGHQQEVRSATGLGLDATFAAPKMAWLLSEGGVAPGPRLALGTLDAWILWKLTGGGAFATDPSSASRTLLYDTRYGAWSTELCDLFGVPTAALPEVRRTSGRLGSTGAGVPVGALVAGPPAALFGVGCVRPGMAAASLGRGSAVLAHAGEDRPAPADGLLAPVAWSLPGCRPAFALEGSTAAAGGAVDWLCHGLGIAAPGEVGRLAESVRDAQGVAFVPAFSGLGSPWNDPRARGTVVGLTRGSGRAQLVRAAVDAVAYQTRDVVDAMAVAMGRPVTELRVHGEGGPPDLALQLLADQLRVPVARAAAGAGAAAVGAALLAGLAEGLWTTVDEVAGLCRARATVDPRAPQSVADSRYAGWRRAVERARRWS